ncbi:MAG: glycosyltransferase, partial [Bacteroidales bacterium]|nr:glycosyltransferase [Bacteroidales bacterium]
MKKVLIISYAFSDKRAIGSIRIQGLAKFLPEFGWEPKIITAKCQAKLDSRFNVIETSYESRDDKLKKGFGINKRKSANENVISPSYENKNAFINFISDFYSEIFNYPDKYKGWYTPALEMGTKLLKEERFDAIISSSSPVTSHLIAYELKSKCGIPWIADLRDLWTQNHYYPYSKIRKLMERRLELKILSMADALITTTHPFAEKLKNMHKRETYCITNGFDNGEFENLKPGLTENFSITYTGGLYRGKRDPSILFDVVKELIAEKIINPNDIIIRFYGVKENWLEPEINSYG